MRKSITIFSFLLCIYVISSGQDFNYRAAPDILKRISADSAIFLPSKSMTFEGADTNSLMYSFTSYYKYDNQGRIIEVYAYDTTTNTLIGHGITEYINSGDTLIKISKSKDGDEYKDYNWKTGNVKGFIHTSKVEGKWINHFKNIKIDSAGFVIIDSNFQVEAGVWRSDQTTRTFYNFTSGLVSKITRISNNHLGKIYKNEEIFNYENGILKTSIATEWGFRSDTVNTITIRKSYKLGERGSIDSSYNEKNELISTSRSLINSNGNYSDLFMKSYKDDSWVVDFHNKYKYNESNQLVEMFSYDYPRNYQYKEIYSDYTDVTITRLSDKVKNSDVKLFPIPAKDYVNVSLEENTKGKINNITISNQLGNEVYSTTVETNEIIIDISTISAGLYYITIKSDEGIKNKTFLKE